jgi:hypothetical protein
VVEAVHVLYKLGYHTQDWGGHCQEQAQPGSLTGEGGHGQRGWAELLGTMQYALTVLAGFGEGGGGCSIAGQARGHLEDGSLAHQGDRKGGRGSCK